MSASEQAPPAGAAALPFFVYGTLRSGGHNHAAHLAGRCAEIRPAVLDGAALHDGPGFPYVVPDPDPGRRVVGELITVRPDAYPGALVALDRLEECRADGTGLYVRRRLTVRTAAGERREAWVYLAGPAAEARLRARPALIASGDWADRWGRAGESGRVTGDS
ncbi:gamma-glutamylcyclotransferase family protein [Kitasatospora sp. NPDC096077]|uniref:gamma-glutamylcyclotransferase family protein n=1 Tax=Kitasatospora sp. NPDC096077 TaxID=3155544 RepID=UPI00332D40B3